MLSKYLFVVSFTIRFPLFISDAFHTLKNTKRIAKFVEHK